MKKLVIVVPVAAAIVVVAVQFFFGYDVSGDVPANWVDAPN